jgi:antitoxin YefM
MITGSKHFTVVGKDGKIELPASNLPEGTAIEVIILTSDQEDISEKLLAHNRDDLLEAIDRVEQRQDLVTFTSEEWNAQYNV